MHYLFSKYLCISYIITLMSHQESIYYEKILDSILTIALARNEVQSK